MNIIVITIFVFFSNNSDEFSLKKKIGEIEKLKEGFLLDFKRKEFNTDYNVKNCLKMDNLKNKHLKSVEQSLYVESSISRRVCTSMIKTKKIENLIESLYEIDFNSDCNCKVLKKNVSEKIVIFNYTQTLLGTTNYHFRIDFTQEFQKYVDFSIITHDVSNKIIYNYIYKLSEFLYSYKFDHFSNYFNNKKRNECCGIQNVNTEIKNSTFFKNVNESFFQNENITLKTNVVFENKSRTNVHNFVMLKPTSIESEEYFDDHLFRIVLTSLLILFILSQIPFFFCLTKTKNEN